jgi:hypothetical protein
MMDRTRGTEKCIQFFLSANGRDQLGDLGNEGRTTLKQALKINRS